jgi:hypothetical protein
MTDESIIALTLQVSFKIVGNILKLKCLQNVSFRWRSLKLFHKESEPSIILVAARIIDKVMLGGFVKNHKIGN